MSATPDADRSAGRRADLIGHIIGGRYRVVRYIGEGGMGAVYEVERDGGTAAVKLIAGDGRRLEPRALRRFEREARLAAEIDHPHVARTFELGHDDELDAPFLVMELLRGKDLGALLAERAPLAPEVCVRLALEAARGLAAAHAHGVVHRDVKPQNLFLHEGPDGVVSLKVCDFGVAKLADPARAGDVSSLTHSGGIIGSPRYMSPEQAQSAKDIDARADVWSLCASLYEALTGQRPWQDTETLGEIIVAICTRPMPSLVRVAPWVAPELAAVVHRGLERDRLRRWQDMATLAAALEPHAGERVALTWSSLSTVAAVERARPVPADALETHADTTDAVAELPIERVPASRLALAAAVVLALGALFYVGFGQGLEGVDARGAPSHAAPVPTVSHERASSAPSAEPTTAPSSAATVSPAATAATTASAPPAPPPTAVAPPTAPVAPPATASPTALPTREEWR